MFYFKDQLVRLKNRQFCLEIVTAGIAVFSRYQDRKIAGKFSGGDIASGRGVLAFPRRHGIRPWVSGNLIASAISNFRMLKPSLLESV